MELTQAQLNSLQVLTVNSGKIKADNLAPGQQLVAKVAAINPETGEVTLSLNNTQVTVKTLLQLTVGQSLQLTVAQSNLNKVTLQLPQSLLDTLTLQTALRESLPKQQPVTDLLIQLKSLLNQTKLSFPLPEKIIQFSKKFVSSLPTPAQLNTAQGVKQAIQQSGVFLEKKLSALTQGQTGKTIESDIKSLLLGLKSVLSSEKQNQISLSINKNLIKQSDADNHAVKQNISENIPQKTAIKNEVTLQTSILKKLFNHPLARPATLTLSKQSASTTQTPVGNIEQLKYKTIVDSRLLEKNIADYFNSVEAKTNNKQLFTDKQIQQILNNILHPQKTPTTKTSPPSLPPLTPWSNTTAQSNTQILTKLAQQYINKQSPTLNSEIPLTAIKSQHVSEVSTSRINNLVDLIDTLIKQVDSAISRTQLHQLNAMQDQDTGKLAMSVEIPVNDDDNLHLVQLHIEKDSARENETESMVTVNLAVDLDAIGPVYARITLIKENTSVVFWAERESTFDLMQNNVESLQDKLKTSGLIPENIACHHGQPPQSRFIETKLDENLLDVRA